MEPWKNNNIRNEYVEKKKDNKKKKTRLQPDNNKSGSFSKKMYC